MSCFYYFNPFEASKQMSDISPKISEQASSVNKAVETYQWALTAYQVQGNLWLAWNTDAPFRAAQGQIAVYTGRGFPANPQDNIKVWKWDEPTGTWDTGLPWGSDWYCAWIAQTGPAGGPYVYVVQVITQ
jgi:hypothetical protein